jgi:hypothetical protein
MSGEKELRKISREELVRTLQEHRKWVKSKGAEGRRADLSNAFLKELDLTVKFPRFGGHLEKHV